MASTTISGLGSSGGSSTKSADTVNAYRDADFLKIMLTEITNQDPLQPSETGKLVENIKQLQDLANSTYEKFRSDLGWAQQLMGQTVSVQQQALTPAEKQKLLDKGLKPDVGFAQVNGRVTSFRTVEQQVYVTVGDKDYPMDNIKQIVPTSHDAQYLATMADQLLGKQVAYRDDKGVSRSGQVSSVKYAADGSILLQIGTASVPFKDLTQIGVSGT